MAQERRGAEGRVILGLNVIANPMCSQNISHTLGGEAIQLTNYWAAIELLHNFSLAGLLHPPSLCIIPFGVGFAMTL